MYFHFNNIKCSGRAKALFLFPTAVYICVTRSRQRTREKDLISVSMIVIHKYFPLASSSITYHYISTRTFLYSFFYSCAAKSTTRRSSKSMPRQWLWLYLCWGRFLFPIVCLCSSVRCMLCKEWNFVLSDNISIFVHFFWKAKKNAWLTTTNTMNMPDRVTVRTLEQWLHCGCK